MGRLIYLLVLVGFLNFTACSSGVNTEEKVVVCTDNCQKWCCLGCKATEGNAKCIVLDKDQVINYCNKQISTPTKSFF